MMKYAYSLLLLLLVGIPGARAQRIVCSGHVTEAATGQPVPFASVFVRGTSQGTTADDNGRYQLTLAGPADTLVATAIGFAPQRKALPGGASRFTVNFALGPGSVSLGEVVVRPRENPAYAILRRVQQQKPRNDKRQLTAFEFDSYNRTEVSLRNLPAQLGRRTVLGQITRVADSLGVPRDSSGRPVVPIFASEVLSRFYQLNQPLRKREVIRQRQLRGAAPREGSVVSQILGASFQDWDFYLNWQQLLGKDFISPIADGWRFTYEYELQDSVWVGEDFCYRLAVAPRRPQDLAFTGTIWITKEGYALRRLDLRVSPRANLNYVEGVQVSQELTPTPAGPWLPRRTRVVIGLKPTKGSTGVEARFITVNSAFDANQPHPLPFYDRPLETAPEAFQTPADYFARHRPDSLSTTEQATLAALDSVQRLPAVRSVLEIADVAVNGYYRAGRFDLGPVLSTYGFNNIEGHRLRVGFRTTPELSRDWLLRTYLAYGTRDGRFKYGLRVNRILDRQRWTVLGFEHRHDIDQVALLDNDYALENPLFEASARLGNISSGRPLRRTLTTVSAQTDLFRGFTPRVLLRYQHFTPLYSFAYYTETPAPGAPTDDQFSLAEVVLETRYAPDEVLVQDNQNRRTPIGLKRWPVFTLRYTRGVHGLLGADFSYHKFNLLIDQSIRLGQLGRTDYRLDAGYIPSTVPYPVLKTHLGNESPFYNSGAFNLMRFFEFVSDRYVAFRFENYFDGFLLNSVPAIRQLNWRLVATGNVLWGGVSEANRRIIPAQDPKTGAPLPSFRSLSRAPYAEVGYGIENILKVARVDFLHRLTYRNSPGARTFGVKVSLQFKL
ncbi:DUF5686 and carboxypeptidase-like regulatory domain-containing protein [Hymenobacter weizhouensis]|uniref:DUF5686 and carboxypeptidase-like regulatory domain-containing protein n=1 Tax=Hymenobacter sp. YIM 151500-1 TaxID=2987689 RepID=UPI002226162A|nr:DUF5686 and carboxypeptidase-like regulatory domain-containing protein [Hymenobacter sp. YIM 151500-1]UYZ62352.1 DUF5686 and carboxypeptidase regulatory-like domain-containing protein [Hymenobacter sp. YIM 151500-1]